MGSHSKLMLTSTKTPRVNAPRRLVNGIELEANRLDAQEYSWFSLTTYQNSEALNNRFGFQNVYGIVENSKLHIWAKF